MLRFEKLESKQLLCASMDGTNQAPEFEFQGISPDLEMPVGFDNAIEATLFDPDSVTRDERSTCPTINLEIDYGTGAIHKTTSEKWNRTFRWPHAGTFQATVIAIDSTDPELRNTYNFEVVVKDVLIPSEQSQTLDLSRDTNLIEWTVPWQDWDAVEVLNVLHSDIDHPTTGDFGQLTHDNGQLRYVPDISKIPDLPTRNDTVSDVWSVVTLDDEHNTVVVRYEIALVGPYNAPPPPDVLGDVNGDHRIDQADRDIFFREFEAGRASLLDGADADEDGDVDLDDHAWFRAAFDIPVGDVNYDGVFDSSDLIKIFQLGRYETGQSAAWHQGDWNFDGRFDTSDLVAAFIEGRYQA